MRASTKPASRSTLRCFETEGCDSCSWCSMSLTDRSDVASRLRMARRFGSAMIPKVDSTTSIYAITYVPVKPYKNYGNIAALGFRVQDVKLILNSLDHFDHAGERRALDLVVLRREAALPEFRVCRKPDAGLGGRVSVHEEPDVSQRHRQLRAGPAAARHTAVRCIDYATSRRLFAKRS